MARSYYRTHPVQQYTAEAEARYQASAARTYTARRDRVASMIGTRQAKKAARDEKRRLEQLRLDAFDQEQLKFDRQQQLLQAEHGYRRELQADQFGFSEQAAVSDFGRQTTRDVAQFGQERTLQGDRAAYDAMSLEQKAELDRVAQERGYANGFEMMTAEAGLRTQEQARQAEIARGAMGDQGDIAARAAGILNENRIAGVEQQADIAREAASVQQFYGESSSAQDYLDRQALLGQQADISRGAAGDLYGHQRDMASQGYFDDQQTASQKFANDKEMTELKGTIDTEQMILGFDHDEIAWDRTKLYATQSAPYAAALNADNQIEEKKRLGMWILPPAAQAGIDKARNDIVAIGSASNLSDGEKNEQIRNKHMEMFNFNKMGHEARGPEMPRSTDEAFDEDTINRDGNQLQMNRETGMLEVMRGWQGSSPADQVDPVTGYSQTELIGKQHDAREKYASHLQHFITTPKRFDPDTENLGKPIPVYRTRREAGEEAASAMRSTFSELGIKLPSPYIDPLSQSVPPRPEPDTSWMGQIKSAVGSGISSLGGLPSLEQGVQIPSTPPQAAAPPPSLEDESQMPVSVILAKRLLEKYGGQRPPDDELEQAREAVQILRDYKASR